MVFICYYHVICPTYYGTLPKYYGTMSKKHGCTILFVSVIFQYTYHGVQMCAMVFLKVPWNTILIPCTECEYDYLFKKYSDGNTMVSYVGTMVFICYYHRTCPKYHGSTIHINNNLVHLSKSTIVLYHHGFQTFKTMVFLKVTWSTI